MKTHPEVAQVMRMVRHTDVVVTSEADDEIVAVAIGRKLTAAQSSHPGWWVYRVHVPAAYQSQGHGFTVVAGLLRELAADTVYLARRPDDDRAFAGGFGFVPLDEPWNVLGSSPSGMALYVASPPDPDWTPS